MDKGDEQVLSDIEKYGLHVVKVIEDETGPGFGYSIGLYKTYHHPEIVIVGLKLDLIHSLINDIAQDIKNGKSYLPENYYSDVLDGFECYFTEVDNVNYKEYVGYAMWYYNGDKFPLLQCIYPTVKGIYPWDPEWPEEIKNLQPILGDLKLG